MRKPDKLSSRVSPKQSFDIAGVVSNFEAQHRIARSTGRMIRRACDYIAPVSNGKGKKPRMHRQFDSGRNPSGHQGG
jgi:hypothetical protein